MDGQGYFGGSTYIQKPANNRRRLLLIVSGVVVVILVAILGIATANSGSGPKSFSKKYLEAVAEQDVEKSYAMLSDDLAKKTNKETFQKSLVGYSKLASVATFVSESVIDETTTQVRYTAQYGAIGYDLSIDVSRSDDKTSVSAYTVTQKLFDLQETKPAEVNRIEETK